ncbi:hypothetical protein CCH79_00013099 [Gambusia affinis]|uniref:Uncharacterized protein n=1 Tax=Gambusia affinis TaxID=33528 RepID=A0A315WDI1_GAMAF|nr:hypothetical protein CCH79_00013099 [Gambusia affinis]
MHGQEEGRGLLILTRSLTPPTVPLVLVPVPVQVPTRSALLRRCGLKSMACGFGALTEVSGLVAAEPVQILSEFL